jgi:hypothetical protein
MLCSEAGCKELSGCLPASGLLQGRAFLGKAPLSRISRYAPERLEISSPPPFDDDDEFRQDASSPAHTFTMAAVYENLSSDLVWQIIRTLPTTENIPGRN